MMVLAAVEWTDPTSRSVVGVAWSCRHGSGGRPDHRARSWSQLARPLSRQSCLPDRPPRRSGVPRGRGVSAMDRLVRARILLAEAAALGVTFDDLIAESSSGAWGTPGTGQGACKRSNRWGAFSAWK